MKKSLIQLFIAIIALNFLSSCTLAVTNKLWGPNLGYDEIESFFIDHENHRIVLVGEAGYATKKGTNHYSITDKSGKVFKVFQISLKSESGVYASFYNSTAKGSKVDKIWIAFGMKNLSKDDQKFLNDFNESGGKKIGDFGFYLSKENDGKITRYPSSKEKFQNICSKTNKDPNCSAIIKLARPWQGPISNADTIPKLFGKLAITPLAIAADIALTPLNAVIYLMENRPHK